MKENISIIFAVIIGTFLVVILPLYSILDRQDSMSYNVVLTETTKFVDNVRNTGFIDSDSYTNYINAISSTSNTYKVVLEAYKNTLIHETDEYGNIINDSYLEQKELYNTKDILEVLEKEKAIDVSKSNLKNKVYLLEENDEFYVRVYNTNMTTGSILYNLIAGVNSNKVINISYGGVVNKVNWELYNKIQSENLLVPEVVMSVPVNLENSTNVTRIDDTSEVVYIDCTLENIDEFIGETNVAILCGDELAQGAQTYAYIYDLEKTSNRTIRVAVELREFDKIDIGQVLAGNTDTYASLTQLNESFFNSSGEAASAIEKYIIANYIRLDNMKANIDLSLRQKGDYYIFDILLTKVNMLHTDYIATLASINVLPGLGIGIDGTPSIGGKTVDIELVSKNVDNIVSISSPHIWNKLIKTKNLTESRITDNTVYAKEDIAFVISYMGLTEKTNSQIVEAIRENLEIYSQDTGHSNIEIYTQQQLNENFAINISTELAKHIVVKFRYNSSNDNTNYIELIDGWIETIASDEEAGTSTIFVDGAKSVEYKVLKDDSAPLLPTVAFDGEQGKNGWYTSYVTLNMFPSIHDTVIKNNEIQIGGCGVDRSTITLEGAINSNENESLVAQLEKDGVTYVTRKAYDYAGNVAQSERETIKIDTTAPSKPAVRLVGTAGKNGWYTSEVTLNIIPGTDETSGVDKTTYKILGANSLSETEGLSYTLTKDGKSTVIVTTYDKAGNKSETNFDIFIDKTTPHNAIIKVIEGDKNSKESEWYCTNVTLQITVDVGQSASGLANSNYRITGDSQVAQTSFAGTTKQVQITENGTHTLTVYTYNQAGSVNVTTYTVNIDKSSPNSPTIEVVDGIAGENDWYISNVDVKITSNGDVGTSQENMMTYTITKDGNTTIEKEILSDTILSFTQEGQYILTVYSRDIALNKTEVKRKINIDKTLPMSADFVITGTKGIDGWYISNVSISHTGSADNVSGINNVQLSTNSITQNTAGTKVTMITKDNAGNKVTKEVTIRLDKSVPTNPTINIQPQPTGEGIYGVLLYNCYLDVTITPGEDSFITNVTNQDKTTYEVRLTDTDTMLLPETESSTLKIAQEGRYTIIARTYDKAGNVSQTSTTVWIDETKPETPKIISINGTNIENTYLQEIESSSNKIILNVDNLSVGNLVKIVLVNQSTYERIEIEETATADKTLELELANKGTYSITVTQTNMFGTQSAESTGVYYYKYR